MTLKKDFVKLKNPYYWVNILLSLSYICAKKIAPICVLLFPEKTACELDMRESEILFFLIIIIAFRSRKTGSVTMVNYLSSSFIYAKVANLILWFYADIRFGLVFGAIFVYLEYQYYNVYIIWFPSYLCHIIDDFSDKNMRWSIERAYRNYDLLGLLLPEPAYTGPENITYFRAGGLDEELERDKRITWIVCFYAAWNPSCVNFAPVFAELSAQYNLDNLKFGKVDVGRFPDVAKKHRVSDAALSRQLPTVILYKEGKESVRRPFIDSTNQIKKFFFSEDNMKAEFGLNGVYNECKNNPLKVKKPKKIENGHEKAD